MTRNCSHQDEANNNTKSNHSAGNELKDPLSRIEAALQHHKMTTLTVICNFTNFKQDGGENLSQRNRNYVIPQGKGANFLWLSGPMKSTGSICCSARNKKNQ